MLTGVALRSVSEEPAVIDFSSRSRIIVLLDARTSTIEFMGAKTGLVPDPSYPPVHRRREAIHDNTDTRQGAVLTLGRQAATQLAERTVAVASN